MGYVDTRPFRSRVKAIKDAWWEKLGLASMRAEHKEYLSHRDTMRRLGYLPDQAQLRIRRAQPPDLPKPKGGV